MAGSGVMRLRLAHAKGGSNPRMKNPSSGAGNRVKVNVNVGSGLAPKKSSSKTRQVPSYTNPPISNEQPSRGEHGRNTSQTSKRNDSQK